ncbi:MAG: N-acetylmuramoyl-L-alanine amidase [Synergistaceae bacterium]|nr:N-acetylmuramoyl-L-alanine amidase [Synergistaceae bacterium]
MFLFFLPVLFAALCVRAFFAEDRLAFHALSPENRVYVLDAGHGGEDGGAVSRDGAKESDINLAIVRDLDALLGFLGYDTLLTRTDDRAIYSEGAETLRQKKSSDLKNRVELVNRTEGSILVSIHQNSFPTASSVRGAQAFHGVDDQGTALARSIQSALNKSVNLGNEKHEKKIDPSIYLMKRVERPAVLVECGFLSNAAESQKLGEPSYQRMLAVAIAAGLLNAEEYQ